ncbi:MAG: portal protein [Prosthecobacter sp.]|nr:portal protein [Prosthecobacter sp.]
MEPTKTTMYAKKDDPRALAWWKRYEALRAERAVWESSWQEIADYFLPRKAGVQSLSGTPANGKEANLFDTSGQDAAIQAAAGLLSWTTPANEPWFAWEPAREMRGSDAVKQWLQECSELAREYLANSNFYTERHEDLLNHCTFCTSALFVNQDASRRTTFKALSIGTYVIAENHLGQVDTLYREFELTARQAQQQFGFDKLGREAPLPENIARCLEGDARQEDKKFTFIHVVEPRAGSQMRGAGTAAQADWQKAFVSVYIEKESKAIVNEGGFDAFPYMVGRWLKAKFGESESVWGYGPGFAALPEARQLNFLQKMMDVHAEKAVFPPMMVPDTLEGELNISARGITYLAHGIDVGQVAPLPMLGDYKVGLERVEMRRKAIETKFHVDFFQMFRNTDPRITATQVNEMASERLTMISPAFARLVSEKDTPMLTRCFELWARSAMLPPPPAEAMRQDGQGISTPSPEVVYTSRLALAVRALRNLSFDRSFSRIMQIAAQDPAILDNINMPLMVRDSMRNDGVPASWIRGLDEVEEMRAARAQQQQQMAQMQMAEQGSKALANAAKAGPELRELVGV